MTGMLRSWRAAAPGFLLLLLSACTSTVDDTTAISGTELRGRLGLEDAPIVLDVRSAGEYQGGHVPGAYNIEDREIQARIEEILQLKDREIVVYCQAGPRARRVEKYLRDQGFTNVRHLTGDFSAWRRNGNPVE